MENYSELNYNQVYNRLKNNESFVFQATREELNFTNLEKEITSVNFDIPFRLPLLNSLENLIDLLLRESVGQIMIGKTERIKILTEVFGGTIFYQRIDSKGDYWKVMIIFPAKTNTK